MAIVNELIFYVTVSFFSCFIFLTRSQEENRRRVEIKEEIGDSESWSQRLECHHVALRRREEYENDDIAPGHCE